MARGAVGRGKRIAFGDGKRIIWGPHSAEVFYNNPNIAKPGSERDKDIEWVSYYKGHRIYNQQSIGRWVWNYDFSPMPGQMYFDETEKKFAESITPGFILIEPNVPWHKTVAANKDWGLAKYQKVADALFDYGFRVAQFSHGKNRLSGVEVINVSSYRMALAALSRARSAILPEGGLHHGAAAVGVKAVVIFGGFIPAEVTGYPTHENLTGGAKACGSFAKCDHCRKAMDAISVDDVLRGTYLL